MKKYLIVCLVFMAILLQGCVVKSLHPFFNDEDVVYRKELLNAWTDQDGNYWTIKPYKKTVKKGTKGNDKPPLPSYEMHYLLFIIRAISRANTLIFRHTCTRIGDELNIY